MAIKIYELRCPTCGATVNYEEDKRLIKCPYCKTLLEVDDPMQTDIPDEVKIIRAETEQIREVHKIMENHRREMQKTDSSDYLLIIFIVLGILFFFLMSRL